MRTIELRGLIERFGAAGCWMVRRRRLLAVLPGATLVLMPAGCGGSRSMVGSSVSDQLLRDVEKLVGGMSVMSAARVISAQNRGANSCAWRTVPTAQLLGSPARCSITTGASGYRFSSSAPTASGPCSSNDGPSGAGSLVQCPDLVPRAYPSTRVTCVVGSLGVRRDVFVFVNAEGGFTMKLGPVTHH
jgi:hypothetical protein